MKLNTFWRCSLYIMRTKSVIFIVLSFGLVVVFLNLWNAHIFESSNCLKGRNNSSTNRTPAYAAFGRKLETGYLNHVFTILEKAGYERQTLSSDWDLLWSHEYPFRVLKKQLLRLDKYKKVNHFPGSGYITNKVNLATSGLPYVPVAFKIPNQKQELLEYVKNNPDRLFVQKSNNHRGIKIQPLSELDLETNGTFIQEYIHKPLLVDGHKFDIGVYTIITSIDPLRVYAYDGDILFRFCPEKYHPFNANNVNKYVVGDDYLPIWDVPSMKHYYKDLGFGMRDSFNAYMKFLGKDPNVIWHQIYEALRAMLLSREMALVAAASEYVSKRNFFEMMRVDFVIDEDLNVYIMEANMSPNLSSQHFPPNRLLYEQVIYNTLKLVGVIPIRLHSRTLKREEEMSFREPEGAIKDLVVFPELCKGCNNCSVTLCKLCKPCMNSELFDTLWEAYREHNSRHRCRRVVPPSLTTGEAVEGIEVDGLTEINQLMHHWFRGKCLLDASWC